MHENELLPDVNAERSQAVLFTVKILDAFEVGNALERSVETIGPAVIRALQTHRRAARLSHDSGGVVTADVEKSAQLAILPADHENRLSRNFSGDVLPRRGDLFRSSDHLPGAAENRIALQIGDAFVGVPGTRNGRSLTERLLGVKIGNDFPQRF